MLLFLRNVFLSLAVGSVMQIALATKKCEKQKLDSTCMLRLVLRLGDVHFGIQPPSFKEVYTILLQQEALWRTGVP